MIVLSYYLETLRIENRGIRRSRPREDERMVSDEPLDR